MAAHHSVSTLIGRCTLQLCASQVSRSPPRHSTLSRPAAFYFDTFSRSIRSGGGFAVPRPHGTAVCTQLDTKSNFTHGLLERPDPRWKECLYVCGSDCEVEQIKATLDDEQVRSQNSSDKNEHWVIIYSPSCWFGPLEFFWRALLIYFFQQFFTKKRTVPLRWHRTGGILLLWVVCHAHGERNGRTAYIINSNRLN